MLSKLISKMLLAAAAIGVAAGIIGPDEYGWYVCGIANGMYISALGLWINT